MGSITPGLQLTQFFSRSISQLFIFTRNHAPIYLSTCPAWSKQPLIHYQRFLSKRLNPCYFLFIHRVPQLYHQMKLLGACHLNVHI